MHFEPAVPGLRLWRAVAIALALLTTLLGWGFTYWQASFIDSLTTRSP